MKHYLQGFEFFLPTKIVYGLGAMQNNLPGELQNLNAKSVTVITDKGIAKAGLLDTLTQMLEELRVTYKVFDAVEPNPSTDTCYQGAEMARSIGAQALIAMGGGSPMDVAKSVALLLSNGGDLQDYEGPNKFIHEPLPYLAIPTTAGTGSEVTPYAVITVKDRNYKMTIISHQLLPKAALLDPALIGSVPGNVAAACGVDVLTHAIEAYTNLVSSPFTDACALQAIRLIGKYLRRYVANRKDMEAASGMLVANTLAGVAFGIARLGNVHAMAHPVSGFFDVPHGVANAILLPHVMKFNLLADKGQFKRIAELLGEDVGGLSDLVAGPLAIESVSSLISDVRIPRGLSDVGVTEDKIPAMAADAMLSGNVKINPRATTLEDIIALYHQAM